MFEQLFIPSNYFFNPYSIPGVLASAFTFGVGLFILFKNKSAPVNIAFFLVTLCISSFGGFALLYSMKDRELALYAIKHVFFVGAIGVPPAFFFLAVAYVGKLREYRISLIVVSLIAYIFYLLLKESDLLIMDATKFFWGWYAVYYTKGMIIFLIYLLFVAGSGFLILLKSTLVEKNIAKRRATKIMMLTLAIGSLSAIDFAPGFGLSIYPFGHVPITIAALIIAYTVVRHNVLDITSTVAANTIVQTIPDALLVTDPAMNIVFVNKESAEILGYSREELENMSLSEVVRKEDSEILSSDLETPDAKKDLEVDLLTKDGKKIPVSVSAADIAISDKINAGRVIVAKDMRRTHDLVTSLKNSTDELKQKVGELEHFNKITVDRELKMIELKEKIKELEGAKE